MRSVAFTAYGAADLLALRDVPSPVPGPGEVRIHVHATTVTAGDTELRSSNMPWLFRIPLRLWMGVSRPRAGMVLGQEVAGVVDAIGEGVDGYALGDAVMSTTGMRMGGYAEWVCVPVSGLIAKKPPGVAFEDAAALPIGGLAALGYLRKGGVEAGKRVLVRGASGSIGTYAVQLAKHLGAHVTGVCPPDGVESVRELGADEVLDYTRRDFTETDDTYDVFLDVVGRMPIGRCLRSVRPGGAYIRATVPGLRELLTGLVLRVLRGKRVVMGDAGGLAEDLAFLAGLVEGGQLRTVVDRRYPLEDIAAAHAYAESGHKQGNVVIVVQPSQ